MCSSRGAFAKWSSFNFRAKDTRKVSLKDWQGIYWVSHFIYLLYRWREWWTWKHVSDIDDHEGGDQKDDHDDDDISLTLLMIMTMMIRVSPYWFGLWWSYHNLQIQTTRPFHVRIWLFFIRPNTSSRLHVIQTLNEKTVKNTFNIK